MLQWRMAKIKHGLLEGEYWAGDMTSWMAKLPKVEDCCVYVFDGKEGMIE